MRGGRAVKRKGIGAGADEEREMGEGKVEGERKNSGRIAKWGGTKKEKQKMCG